jgi:CRP-like cAMP-binding protein
MEINKEMMLYYGLSEADLERTVSSYKPLSIPSKQFFLEEGKISDKIGFVKSGLLRAYFYDEDGNDITTQFFPTGSLIISTDSFNNQKPSEENIVAVTNSELMVISYQKQQELYREIPAWNNICRDIADQKGKEMLDRSVQLQTLSATERYQQFCRDNPEVVLHCPLSHIASYLGIDIATLSRIRKKV